MDVGYFCPVCRSADPPIVLDKRKYLPPLALKSNKQDNQSLSHQYTDFPIFQYQRDGSHLQVLKKASLLLPGIGTVFGHDSLCMLVQYHC